VSKAMIMENTDDLLRTASGSQFRLSAEESAEIVTCFHKDYRKTAIDIYDMKDDFKRYAKNYLSFRDSRPDSGITPKDFSRVLNDRSLLFSAASTNRRRQMERQVKATLIKAATSKGVSDDAAGKLADQFSTQMKQQHPGLLTSNAPGDQRQLMKHYAKFIAEFQKYRTSHRSKSEDAAVKQFVRKQRNRDLSTYQDRMLA
jgi:hypothetical protein